MKQLCNRTNYKRFYGTKLLLHIIAYIYHEKMFQKYVLKTKKRGNTDWMKVLLEMYFISKWIITSNDMSVKYSILGLFKQTNKN